MEQALPADKSGPSLSIIVPTYKEAESLPLLLDRVEELRKKHGLDLELLIMDDNSRDGTEELILKRALPWVRLVVRTSNRGLSPAVVDGLKLARNEVLIVMDADLSHPPERIPDMLQSLAKGSEFVIGSRYVSGGSTDEAWGVFRWLNSKVATLLARPFTRLSDPMSGFFALRKSLFERADALSPIGYKIGLELLVKCKVTQATEIPIRFAQRQQGESKLSFKEQLRYLQHLRRLFSYCYPNWSSSIRFVVVGALAGVLNIVALTLLLWKKMPVWAAVGVAIGISMLSMLALDRRFALSSARRRPQFRQLFGFIAACSLGAAINYGVTLWILSLFPRLLPQLAAVTGILSGAGAHCLAGRLGVFRPTPRPVPEDAETDAGGAPSKTP